MIQFANEQSSTLVRQMWKICFEDTEDFIDLYFAQKYDPQNTLVYFEGDEAVASLQMLPYTINFYGENIPFYYLAGLCTLPAHRQKGYMAQLIHKSHQVMEERDIPLAILVPAEKWLFGFYEKFGYEQVFDKSEEPIHCLKKLLDTYPDVKEAYNIFNFYYKDKDFCIQKSFEDFRTIIEEYKNDGSPEKYNLAGMARIMDETHLLNLYANKNPSVETRIKVKDSSFGEDIVFTVTHGFAESMGDKRCDMEVDIRLLCRLLFGYKTDELPEYSRLFPPHQPIMNLMLE